MVRMVFVRQQLRNPSLIFALCDQLVMLAGYVGQRNVARTIVVKLHPVPVNPMIAKALLFVSFAIVIRVGVFVILATSTNLVGNSVVRHTPEVVIIKVCRQLLE
jgi:hypothetical protein